MSIESNLHVQMVTIVDPHIKQDNGYHLYKEAKDQDYFIRNKDNNEFQGWCWPGTYNKRKQNPC